MTLILHCIFFTTVKFASLFESVYRTLFTLQICMQTMHNDPNLVYTRWPFQQDCPALLLELTTWHRFSTVTHSTSLCLAFPVYSKGKLWKHSRVVLNSLITHTTATGNIPEAPELHLAIHIVQSYLVKVAPVVSLVRAKSMFVIWYSCNLSAIGCA